VLAAGVPSKRVVRNEEVAAHLTMAREHAAGAPVGMKEAVAAGNLFLARCFAFVWGKGRTSPAHSNTHDHGKENQNAEKPFLHA